jgi:hypothetical protein
MAKWAKQHFYAYPKFLKAVWLVKLANIKLKFSYINVGCVAN